jgi:hypothetical protein
LAIFKSNLFEILFFRFFFLHQLGLFDGLCEISLRIILFLTAPPKKNKVFILTLLVQKEHQIQDRGKELRKFPPFLQHYCRWILKRKKEISSAWHW